MEKCEYEKILAFYDGERPFRTLYMLMGQGPWFLVRLVFVFMVKHSPSYVVPVAIKYIIDYMVAYKKGDPVISNAQLYIIIAVLLVVVVQNIPTHMLYVSMSGKVKRRIENLLRITLLRRLQMLSISFLNQTESGRLQSKVLRDADKVQNIYELFLRCVLGAIFNISFTVIFTACQAPFMLLFFAVAVPATVFVIKIFKGGMRKRNSQYLMDLETMNAKVSGMIDMVPVARAHGVEEHASKDVEKQLENVRESGYRLDLYNGIFGSTAFVVMQVCSASALLFTCFCCYKGWLKIGDIALYQGFFSMILGSVNILLSTYPELSSGFASIRSLGEIICASDVEYNEGKEHIDTVEGKVEFQDVSYSYPEAERCAINNFSLEVESGKIVAFVGESGSGKTTLMSLVIGFIRPDEGRILLDGKNMNEIDMRSFRRHISVVPQQPMLFSGTLRDNICYGFSSVDEDNLLNAIADANLGDLIDSLPDGLATIVGEGGARLSGGQKQRIAIARALVRNPKLIILDEATSALDTISERQVQEALERLIKGRTTFIVAHRLSTIRNADLIVAMKDGMVVEQGKEDELIKKKGYFYELSVSQNTAV